MLLLMSGLGQEADTRLKVGLLFGVPLSDLDFCLCVLDPCQPNPCEHGGDCVIGGDTFSCSCPAPFSGSRCQTGECISLHSCSPWGPPWSLLPSFKGGGEAPGDPGEDHHARWSLALRGHRWHLCVYCPQGCDMGFKAPLCREECRG